MRTNKDFSAHSAKGLRAVVGNASKRCNIRNVTLRGVTHYIVTLRGVTHYAAMLLMMMLTATTARAAFWTSAATI